jgi:hypothetical protein
MYKVVLIYFDAGGAHRVMSTALSKTLAQQKPDWQIAFLNLQKLFEPMDLFRKVTGLCLEDVYNTLLQRGWTVGSDKLIPPMQWLIRLYHKRQVRMLVDHWNAHRPDMVVSFIPHFNRAIYDSLQSFTPRIPFVTIPVDLADYPPHFWIEHGQEQYFIWSTERGVEQALQAGYSKECLFRVSGMIVDPDFYEPVTGDPREERMKLGLQPDTVTGVVLLGSQGSGVMTTIAKRLDRSGLPVQLIILCGHNQSLAAKLRGLRTRMPLSVQDFTTNVRYYMHLADFFIGKPGPGSMSEALLSKLPVIVERNAHTLPQERYNVEWVREKGVGMVVKSFRMIDRAVAQMLEPETFARLRANAAAYHNRAVFEIPDILEQIRAQESGKVISST